MLTTGDVRRIAARMKISWPHRVVAARRGAENDDLPACRRLSLHPGIDYLFIQGSAARTLAAIDRSGRQRGPAQVADGPAGWVGAIQQAIVALRRLELARFTGVRASPPPSLNAELDAHRLLLALMRRQGSRWVPSADVWLKTVLLRHQASLNNARRKIVETLAALTHTIDADGPLSFAFSLAVQRVYRTHTFTELYSVTLDAMRDIITLMPTVREDAHSAPVVAAAAYLRANLRDTIRLDEIAAAAGVSPAHLARRFKAETGQTVVTRLQQLRIARAKHQLLETDRTVLAVALDCGFETAEHFHRVFKRETGTTPRRYRIQGGSGTRW